ncbi:hypothetical protein VV11_007395 [Trichodesmium erythraeum 21-75]|nr:hypothetical protein [Trichodesmium erythraeum 21-75]
MSTKIIRENQTIISVDLNVSGILKNLNSKQTVIIIQGLPGEDVGSLEGWMGASHN